MKKRLALFFGTLLALLLAYGGYYFASREEQQQGREVVLPTIPERRNAVPMPGTETKIEPGKGLRIIQYDRHHRLQAKYMAEYWKKVGDRFRLTKPYVEWYLRGGEKVTIRAREGIVTAKEVAGRLNVVEGELLGDVRIVLNQRRTPARKGLAERPGDTFRIHVDEVRFDREALLIESDSYVSVFARQADILGRGLRISWSTGPRQLRELKIVHGEYMCIRQGQERFVRDLSLPGGVAPGGPATTAPAGPEQSRAVPAPAPPGGWPAAGLVPAVLAMANADDEPATRPDTAPTTASAPATQPETLPATMTAPAPVPPIVPDTFCAVLKGDVVVTSGGRYLKGADELKLIFEFKQPKRDRRAPASPTSATTATAPATGAPASPAPAPAATATAPAATAPAGAPGLPAGPEPMFVTWAGPLTVKPVRGYEKPIPERLDVIARGERLELADGKTSARCRVFEFQSHAQRGKLIGTKDDPVELTMAGGETIRARQVRFDRAKGVVNLDGAGEMRLGRGTGATVSSGEVVTAVGEEGLDIRWARDVEILLGRRAVERVPAAEQREFLLAATFNGKVHVKQGPTQTMKAEKLEVRFHRPTGPDDPINRPAELHAAGNVHLADTESGDFIKSQNLEVKMSSPAEEKVYPKIAIARGKVSARQEETDITAKELRVIFAAETDKKTGKMRIKPKRLEAEGAVKLTDHRGDDPVGAWADTLTADLENRTAVLTGKLAKVTQKGNEVEGEKIVFDQMRESATVVGRGRLRFDTSTDLSGNKTDKSRPVTIEWTKGTDYRGLDRIAVISGDVVLVTGGDTVRCENMRVLFAPPEKKPKPAEPGEKGVGRFRPKKIAMVLAEKNVRLASERRDAEGFLTRRLTLRSDKGQVAYDTVAEKLTCLGPGTLVMEDYREPEKKPGKPRRDPLGGGGISRPSQSVFDWERSMDMNQKDRVVNLAGKVTMVLRSGREVVLGEKLKVRPWGKLPPGQNMKMHCDHVLAEFAPPPPDEAGKSPGVLTGPRVGPLQLFRARAAKKGYVRVFNGPVEVVCRRILYQRSRDIAVVYGFLAGEPPRNALVYHKDKEKGRLTVLEESSKIVWHPSTNRLEAAGVKVTGGR